tara:strand:- start:937 stop:1656 length:720 start_codon:yes stop_codon:yes gene_type:complete
MLLLFLTNFIFAGSPVPDSVSDPDVNAEIIVEAHRNFEVYIAPVQYHIYDDSIEAVLPHDSVFSNASKHVRNAKVSVGAIYEPVTMHGGVKVYNQHTIEYVWDQCDYKRDHKKCAYLNDHYFVETHVTVDENELTISMSLYNSNLQIISTSSRSDQKVVNWIKQQETNSQTTIIPNNQQIQNCTGAGCNNVPQQGAPTIIRDISQPKEGLPLKWEIPHKLMSKMVYQTSIGLWAGVKLN